MLTIVIRSIIIYTIVLILYRLMGKRQLGQMQPFELVLTLIIADLATIPMAEVSVPVLHGVIPLLTLTVIHFLLTFLSKVSNGFASFLSGKPVIVINPKGLDYKALKNLNLSVDDVFEAIRGCGYFSLEQIQYAIMETNGKISVLPKSEFAPLTLGDMEIQAEASAVPINVINEGKVIEQNLEVAKVSMDKVENILKQASVKKIKDVLVMTIDINGSVYLQQYGKEYVTMQTNSLGAVQE